MKTFSRIFSILFAVALISAPRAATSYITIPDTQIGFSPSITNGNANLTSHGWLPILPALDVLPYVNVRSYGADNTGASDARAAFIAALAAVPQYGVLYVPAGSYKFTSAWAISKSNFAIVGDGASLLFDPSSEAAYFVAVTGDNWHLRGLRMDGNAEARAVIYADSGSDEWSVRNCRLEDGYTATASAVAAGIQVNKGCDKWTITGNIITNIINLTGGSRSCAGVQVSDFGWASAADNVTQGEISGNFIDGVGTEGVQDGDGVRLNLTTGTYSSGVRILSNDIRNFSWRAVKVIGDGATVAANNIENDSASVYSAISSYGSDNNVQGNNIFGVFDSYVIEYASNINPARGGVCSGNSIHITGAGTDSAIGIRLASDCYGVTVSGNTVRDASKIAYLYGKVSGCQLVGNSGTNLVGNGIDLQTDGSNAPWDIQIDSTLVVGGAGSIVRAFAGTNINIGTVSGSVAGTPVIYAAGVTGMQVQQSRITYSAVDQSMTSSTTMVDVTGLTVPIAASKHYRFRAVVQINEAGTAAGIKLGVTGPSAPTAVILNGFLQNATTTVVHQSVDGFATVIAQPVGTTGLKYAILEGTVLNGANAGSITVQFAQNASDASATTIKAGSALEVTQLN